jgi:fucose permease
MHVALALAFLAFVAVGLPDGMLGVAWPSLRAELVRPLEGLGGLILAWSAGYLLSSALSGSVLVRFGFGPMLIASALSMGLGVGGYAVAQDWPVLLAASVVAGAGGGAIDAGINSWVALRRGAGALNVLHGCYGLGAALGPAMISVGLALGSWRLAYAAVGAVFGLLTVLMAVRRSVWDARPLPAGRGSSRHALGEPSVWVGIVSFFFYVGVEVGAAQWAYSLLVEGRGARSTTAAATVSLFWVVFTAGRFLFGVLASRRSIRGLLLTSLVVAVVGAASLALARGGLASAVALAVLGFGLAPVFPLLVAVTPARVGMDLAPAAIGLQVAGATVGGAVVPATLGLVARRWGLEGIPVALLGCSLLLLVWCSVFASGAGSSRDARR